MAYPGWFEGILALFADEAIDEVLVNNTRSMVATSAAKETRGFSSPFVDAAEMGLALQEFALSQGLRLDHLCPAAGGILAPRSFRWHSLIPPAAAQGPVLAVRRHRFERIEVEDFILSPAQAEQLVEVFRSRKSLLIAGPTGCGKSSLLAALLRRYAQEERVIVIEELAELPLLGPGWLRLLAKEANIDRGGQLTVSRLLKDSLRLRPDRLILGELQRGQLAAFVESIWAGHGGSCATFHGGSYASVLQRFRHLFSQELGTPIDFTADLDLWCILLERGHPPKVVDIARMGSLGD